MGALIALTATPWTLWHGAPASHQRAGHQRRRPPVPIYVLGARILEILPIIDLEGNIGLTLCAFSYAGRLCLVVTADATAFPDLGVLVEAWSGTGRHYWAPAARAELLYRRRDWEHDHAAESR